RPLRGIGQEGSHAEASKHPTSNSQRGSIWRRLRCSALDVGCSMFFYRLVTLRWTGRANQPTPNPSQEGSHNPVAGARSVIVRFRLNGPDEFAAENRFSQQVNARP